MATRSKTICKHVGCGALIDVAGYCDMHQGDAIGWQRHRMKKFGGGYGRNWKRIRQQVIKRDDGLCQICLTMGRLQPGSEVDHITPKALGGSDAMSNLQLLCHRCHAEKTVKDRAASVAVQMAGGG